MKSAAALFLLVVFTVGLRATPAPGASRAPEQTQLYGKEYVRLPDWARANDLDVRWLKRDEILQLSNASSKLLLKVDSCEIQLNGVGVWLLFPVVKRNDTVYISRLDVQETLQPILFRPKSRSGSRLRTVCLDPGHGGKDPGNRVGWNQEKRYTLLLAQELREQLTRAGLRVVLTRNRDNFVDLPMRPEVARRRSADLFLSLHFNSAEGSRNSVQGAEVYCLTPPGASSTNSRGEGGGTAWCAGNRSNERSMLLAYQMQRALTRNLAVEDRGVRRARFAVLRDAMMPAILVEAGFMSHPVEGRKIFDPAYRRQIARAILEGVIAYKRLLERGE